MNKIKVAILFLIVMGAVLAIPALGGSFGTSFRSGGVEAIGILSDVKSAKHSTVAVMMVISPVSTTGVKGTLFCGTSSVSTLSVSNISSNHYGHDDDDHHHHQPPVVPVANVQVPNFSTNSSLAVGAINSSGEAPIDILATAPLGSVTSCPSGRVPLDFVPTQFIATLSATKTVDHHAKLLAKTTYSCTLPNPTTLQYLEQRYYTCIKTSDQVTHDDDDHHGGYDH